MNKKEEKKAAVAPVGGAAAGGTESHSTLEDLRKKEATTSVKSISLGQNVDIGRVEKLTQGIVNLAKGENIFFTMLQFIT